MAAPTVTSVEATLALNEGPGSSGTRQETFKVIPAAATDVDLSIPFASIRAISHLTGYLVNIIDDTIPLVTQAEFYYLDQDLDSSKNVLVLNSTNGAKINRVLADSGGALVSHDYLITLFGF